MTHVDDDRISGVRLALRLAQPSDATYIHTLRLDPLYNRHLSKVTGTVKDQENWLRRYKEREAAGREYYYVIERLEDRQPCGLMRLYDVMGSQFTWGSWILARNKPAKAALESAVLIYVQAFERLGMAKSVFDVRRKNDRTLAFHTRFGAIETGRDEQNVYFEYTRRQFEEDKSRHLAILQSE